jgi:hypothetical protein
LREVFEETNGALLVKPALLIPFAKLIVLAKQPFTYKLETSGKESAQMLGKEMHIYVYPVSSDSLPGFSNVEVDGSMWDYQWYKASEVFMENRQMNGDYWQRFCESEHYQLKDANHE